MGHRKQKRINRSTFPECDHKMLRFKSIESGIAYIGKYMISSPEQCFLLSIPFPDCHLPAKSRFLMEWLKARGGFGMVINRGDFDTVAFSLSRNPLDEMFKKINPIFPRSPFSPLNGAGGIVQQSRVGFAQYEDKCYCPIAVVNESGDPFTPFVLLISPPPPTCPVL